MGSGRSAPTRGGPRQKDGPKFCACRTGQEARHSAWLGYIDPKHQAGDLSHRVTKGTATVTEVWTDNGHSEDETFAEIGYEHAVSVANVTEGPLMSTMLKVTQNERSQMFAAWNALEGGIWT